MALDPFKVDLLVFDHEDELFKIKNLYPEGRLLMRIVTNDANSMHSLSVKFGAKRAQWKSLILKCKELGLNLVGVAFHVGSGARDLQQFVDSFDDSSLGFLIPSTQTKWTRCSLTELIESLSRE